MLYSTVVLMTLLARFGLGAGRPASETAVALQRAVDAAAEGGSVEVDAVEIDFGSRSFYLYRCAIERVTDSPP